MDISAILENWKIHQRTDNWYVIDEHFSFELQKLHSSFYQFFGNNIQIPVIFCQPNDANKIVSLLGDEEEEYLWVPAGIYNREVKVIFIFRFDEWTPLLTTLFHEFRHAWQDMDPIFSKHFDTDKKLPYKERITEIDAFRFADEKTGEYLFYTKEKSHI